MPCGCSGSPTSTQGPEEMLADGDERFIAGGDDSYQGAPRIPILIRVQARMALRTPIFHFQIFQKMRTRYQATTEEAVVAVSRSSWARNLAAKNAQLLGFSPGTAEYDQAVNTGAYNLAVRFLGGSTGTTQTQAIEAATPKPGRKTASGGKTSR